MKIATVLSVSAVFALTSLVAAVGCSAPEAPAAKDKSASTEGDDGDKPTTTAPKPATTPKAPTTSTPAKPATTTPAAGADACLTCVGATTKAGLSVTCENACKDDDDACFTKCDTDNCGTDGAACKADFDKCNVQCGGTTPEQDAKFDACIAKNPKAKTFIDCDDKCGDNDNACEDKCWADSKCDDACDTDIDKCDAEAAGAGG